MTTSFPALAALPRAAAARRAGPAAVAAGLLLASGAALAQTETDGRWHGGIAIGGSAASGNTSSRALSVTADGTRATTQDKINLYGLLNYSSSRDAGVNTRTAELLRTGGRYDYNLSERVFVFGGGEAETNKPGGIDRRVGLNVGTGYHVLATPNANWDVFGGIGYTDAKFTDGTSRNGAELLLGEESSHRLSETSTFKQRLVFYPGSSETGNRATFDATLATSITGGWTLNTGLAVRYASKVAPGLKSTDTLLTFGFGYKY